MLLFVLGSWNDTLQRRILDFAQDEQLSLRWRRALSMSLRWRRALSMSLRWRRALLMSLRWRCAPASGRKEVFVF
jgi:hypothetical protein